MDGSRAGRRPNLVRSRPYRMLSVSVPADTYVSRPAVGSEVCASIQQSDKDNIIFSIHDTVHIYSSPIREL